MRRDARQRVLYASAEGALIAVVCLLPLCLGGAPGWTSYILCIGACLAAGFYAAARVSRRPRPDSVMQASSTSKRRAPWVFLLSAFGLVLLIGFVQLVPLPPWLLSVFSPRAAELREFALVPMGLEGWRGVSLDAPSTWRALGRLIGLVSLGFVASQLLGDNGPRRRRFGAAIVLTSVVVALTGLLHKVAQLDSLFGLYKFVANLPLITPFGNSNHLAAFMLLGGSLALGLAVTAPSKDASLGWGICGCICALAAMMSLSRWGIASLALTWAVVGAVTVSRQMGGMRAALPFVAIAGVVVVTGVVALEPFLERLQTVSSMVKLKSTKLEVWPSLLDSSVAHWRGGMGLGAFELGYGRDQSTQFDVTFSHPENIGFQYLSELGWPVGLVVALLIGLGFWALWRTWPGGTFERFAVVTLGGLVLHDLLDFALELNGVAPAAYALLGGLSMGRHGRRCARSLAVLAVVVPVFGSLLVLKGHPDHHLAEASLRRVRSVAELEPLALATVDRHPADYVTYAVMAEATAAGGAPEIALAWINRLLYLRPFDGRAHVAAAQALTRLGRRTQAQGELKLALQSRVGAAIEMAIALSVVDESWLRVVPWTSGVVSQLSAQLRASQPPGVEKTLLDQVLSADDVTPEIAAEAGLLRANWEAAHGDAALAVERYEALPEAIAQEQGAALGRARALIKVGNVEAAKAVLDRLQAQRPNDVEVAFVVASLEQSRGRFGSALEALNRLKPFVAQVDLRAEIFAREAQLLERDGRLARALDAASTAARLEPSRAERHYRVAELEERLGALGPARDALKKGRAVDSTEGALTKLPWLERLDAVLDRPSDD